MLFRSHASGLLSSSLILIPSPDDALVVGHHEFDSLRSSSPSQEKAATKADLSESERWTASASPTLDFRVGHLVLSPKVGDSRNERPQILVLRSAKRIFLR